MNGRKVSIGGPYSRQARWRAGMALFMEKLASEQYAGLDIYARPVTAEGQQLPEEFGVHRRRGNRTDARAASLGISGAGRKRRSMTAMFPTPARKIGITVARTFDDLMRVAAIRNAVYIGEQECPYDEEYDGNDLSATHLLAYIGDEPVGCLRAAFFRRFRQIRAHGDPQGISQVPRRDPAGAGRAQVLPEEGLSPRLWPFPGAAGAISGADSAFVCWKGQAVRVFRFRLCRDRRGHGTRSGRGHDRRGSLCHDPARRPLACSWRPGAVRGSRPPAVLRSPRSDNSSVFNGAALVYDLWLPDDKPSL